MFPEASMLPEFVLLLFAATFSEWIQFLSSSKSLSTMIKLRLKRYGKKREVSYRIVAMNSRDRRDGRPLEELGFYNPRTDEVRLDVEGLVRRLQQGAQPTETVRDLLIKNNVFEQAGVAANVKPFKAKAASAEPVAAE
jgi:small subunit ribosomal protein S16